MRRGTSRCLLEVSYIKDTLKCNNYTSIIPSSDLTFSSDYSTLPSMKLHIPRREDKEKAAQEMKEAAVRADTQRLEAEVLNAAAEVGAANLGNLYAQPGLRERVRMQLDRAQREVGKCARLSELDELLVKNPEIARILDLVEDLRG